MPVLEQPPDPKVELTQGDILSNINFCYTSANGAPAVGGKSNTRPYGLLVSRDCAISNKNRVAVVPIAEISATLPFEKNNTLQERPFDFLKGRLQALRDNPPINQFYLGSLPGSSDLGKRLVAMFDEICSIEIPEDGSERNKWVAARRVAVLSEHFLRGLPVRIFYAFGRVGYDDYSWMGLPDLEMLILAGDTQLAGIKQGLEQAKLALLTSRASGANSKEIGQREASVKKLSEELSEFEKELNRYKAVLDSERLVSALPRSAGNSAQKQTPDERRYDAPVPSSAESAAPPEGSQMPAKNSPPEPA